MRSTVVAFLARRRFHDFIGLYLYQRLESAPIVEPEKVRLFRQAARYQPESPLKMKAFILQAKNKLMVLCDRSLFIAYFNNAPSGPAAGRHCYLQVESKSLCQKERTAPVYPAVAHTFAGSEPLASSRYFYTPIVC